MGKKFWIWVLIGGSIAYAVNHTRVGQHVVTYFNRTVDGVEESITPDIEIGTLKRELKKLESEQVKIRGKYATAKVDAERLAFAVNQTRTELEGAEQALLKRGEDLKKANETDKVSWNGIPVSLGEAKERLQNTVDQYKARKAQVQADEQRLSYLEKDRDTLGQQVATFRAEMTRLNSEINHMQSEIHLLKSEQLRHRNPQDGSELAEMKESLEKLARKIAIEREKLNLNTDQIRSTVGNKSVEEILSGLKDAPKTETQN